MNNEIHCPIENIDSNVELVNENNGEEPEPTEFDKPDQLLFGSLLSLFLSGNLTQSAFKLVLEHTQLLTDIQLLISLDQLLSKTWTFQK